GTLHRRAHRPRDGAQLRQPARRSARRRLEPAMTRIFPLVAEEMRKQAYGSWRIMAYESLVRAVTLLYVRERHGDAAADRLAREDEGASFYWAAELAGELAGRRGAP